MPSIFDSEVESAVRARAARLNADSRPLWGRMQSGQMLCHLVDACRIPLGEAGASYRWTPFRMFPLRWLFVHLLPWPKARVGTMKEFQQTQPSQLELDRGNWNSTLTRFVARGREPHPQWNPHPAFGALPNWEWGRLMYRHIDHHFRQFGV
jgi:hypothetical protein